VSRNELRARYIGSLFGLGWVVIYPVTLLALYALVYLFIFQVKPTDMGSVQYVLYIFAGLIPFMAISEALSSGVTAVVTHRAVLVNTVFPIELVPVKSVLLAQGSLIVGLVVTTLGVIFSQGFSLTMLVAPLLWLLLILFLTGILWIVSVVNIVFRDLQYIINLAITILMFASPIAYTPSMVPQSLKLIILLNPFAYFITAFQNVLVMHTLPTLLNMIILLVLSFGTLWIGGIFFERFIVYMADHV
jgi:lipopolysaccharide transport system permease protein